LWYSEGERERGRERRGKDRKIKTDEKKQT
jgi:hypothetical protein